MKKLKTLYKKNPENLGRVIEELDPNCLWVFDECVRATRKFDGTACMIQDNVLYKRYDNKKGKAMPSTAIECQSADEFSGHHPYWVLCDRDNKGEKRHWEAFDKHLTLENNEHDWEDGTYELIGVKVNRNPERVKDGHMLVKHGSVGFSEKDKDFMLENIENMKAFLEQNDIEGIVFHHPDGRMCKIRKKDFGFKR